MRPIQIMLFKQLSVYSVQFSNYVQLQNQLNSAISSSTGNYGVVIQVSQFNIDSLQLSNSVDVANCISYEMNPIQL